MGQFHKRTGFWMLCLCVALIGAAMNGRAERFGALSYAPLGDGTAEITGYYGGTAVDIPSAIDGLAVTAIAPGAFAGQTELERVAMPEGVTNLGDGAFADCYSLEEVSVPSTIRQVGENPFAGCENLRKLEVRVGQGCLAVINGVLFSDEGRRLVFCPRVLPMERCVAPEGTEVIDARAFSQCSRLLSVVLPDSVRDIGKNAFEGRANLTLVVGRGSYGEQYARRNDIKYTYPDATEWLVE